MVEELFQRADVVLWLHVVALHESSELLLRDLQLGILALVVIRRRRLLSFFALRHLLIICPLLLLALRLETILVQYNQIIIFFVLPLLRRRLGRLIDLLS